jgi:hypothetical protein
VARFAQAEMNWSDLEAARWPLEETSAVRDPCQGTRIFGRTWHQRESTASKA